MKSTHALHLLSLAALGTLTAAPALAQQEAGYYGGLSVGQSRAQIDEERIRANLLGAGLSSTSFSSDNRDVSYKLFGGYQMSRHFALEAGFFSLGKFGFHATTSPPGTLDGEIRLRGFNLDLVGTLPLTERLSAIGRLGAQHAKARDAFRGTGAVGVLNPNPSESETNYKLGAGLQYAFSPSFLMRAEAERYRINDAVGNHGSVNVFSIGLVFPFGRAPAAAPRTRTATPEVVASAAPVAPAVMTPMRRRVKFEAETLFTFDQSALRPEGKQALDTFVQELKGSRFDTISVVGHADRLGSSAYNQTLSQQRADVVKAYLVSAGGIDAAKVSAVGKSEAEPVTLPGACQGSEASAKLIACLQPDRGVEIEVTGTR